MGDQPTLFDAPRVTTVTESKQAGRQASQAANDRGKLGRSNARLAVLAAIQEAGERGLTSKEYALHCGSTLNAVSGRFSELVQAGSVFRRNGKEFRRDGAAVHWAKGHE